MKCVSLLCVYFDGYRSAAVLTLDKMNLLISLQKYWGSLHYSKARNDSD